MKSWTSIILIVPATALLTVAATIAALRASGPARGGEAAEAPVLMSRVHAALDEFMPVSDLAITAPTPRPKRSIDLEPAAALPATDPVEPVLAEPVTGEVAAPSRQIVFGPPQPPMDLDGLLVEAADQPAGVEETSPDAGDESPPTPVPAVVPVPPVDRAPAAAPATMTESPAPAAALAPPARTGVDYGKLAEDLRRAADTLDRFNRKLMQVIERGPMTAAPAPETKERPE